MYKIECYSTHLLGHLIPLAKVTQYIQRRFENSDVTLITLKCIETKIKEKFPSLKTHGVMEVLSLEYCNEQMKLPPLEMFNFFFTCQEEYFKNKKD